MENSNTNAKTTTNPSYLSIFLFSIKARETQQDYKRLLERFFEHIGINGTLEECCNYFVEVSSKDKQWAFNHIINYLKDHKQRLESKEITAGTLKNYLKPIKKLCEIADIDIKWKIIESGLPKAREVAKDRAPTLDEIQRLIEYSDRRIKPIVLTMASSGIRLGAWDYLKWKHIIPIEKDSRIVAAKVIVYDNEESDEYWTLITDEAYFSLKDYMVYREQSGENITGESWLIRNRWDSTTPSGGNRFNVSNPIQLKSSGVKSLIIRALKSQGLRSDDDYAQRNKVEKGEVSAIKKNRSLFDVKAAHGFRKFFNTRCEIAGMKTINVNRLLGHSNGLKDNYYKVTEDEMLEEYLKVSHSLMIGKEHQLKKQIAVLEDQNSTKYEELNVKLEEKDQEIKSIKNEQYIITSQFKVMLSSFNTLDKQNKTKLAREWIQLGIFEESDEQ
jgi:hypothetical protein